MGGIGEALQEINEAATREPSLERAVREYISEYENETLEGYTGFYQEEEIPGGIVMYTEDTWEVQGTFWRYGLEVSFEAEDLEVPEAAVRDILQPGDIYPQAEELEYGGKLGVVWEDGRAVILFEDISVPSIMHVNLDRQTSIRMGLGEFLALSEELYDTESAEPLVEHVSDDGDQVLSRFTAFIQERAEDWSDSIEEHLDFRGERDAEAMAERLYPAATDRIVEKGYHAINEFPDFVEAAVGRYDVDEVSRLVEAPAAGEQMYFSRDVIDVWPSNSRENEMVWRRRARFLEEYDSVHGDARTEVRDGARTVEIEGVELGSDTDVDMDALFTGVRTRSWLEEGDPDGAFLVA